MKLYLIPNVLNQQASVYSIPSTVADAIRHIRIFFVEEPKAARALLRKLDARFPLDECTFVAWNEHVKNSVETRRCLVSIINQGQDAGIISEAGYPCVADPGADLVRLAHAQGIEIVPLPGASSIILALAASGLTGQNFAFNGYLPKEKQARLKKIKALEQRVAREGQTQIVMETPYRSQNVLEDFLHACNVKTALCVAADVTGPQQIVKTFTVGEWKKRKVFLDKIPTLFLIGVLPLHL